MEPEKITPTEKAGETISIRLEDKEQLAYDAGKYDGYRTAQWDMVVWTMAGFLVFFSIKILMRETK